LSKGPVDEEQGHSPFPIVGIGASAGGLEALSQLLAKLPPNTGMAFLVVQHLDPRHESRLAELLARATPLRVLEAEHGQAVQPNHVYVIPPNTNMALAQGILHLTSRGEARGPHLPIDYLFRSLAEGQKGRAIAVVLSGTGSDGTQGVCEVKAVGGITFAQEEKTAAHGGMPASAIGSGCIDFVLPPGDIARRLAEIGRHPYLAPSLQPTKTEPTSQESYQKILAAVRGVSGVDFSHYRDTTIKRRIMRRMALHTQPSLAEYAKQVTADSAEAEALFQDLLINVTSFFRDPEMFDVLKTSVFPELVKGRSPMQPIRVWTPGCSTDQEAYSLAMALVEFFDDKPVHPPIQVFATDLDQAGLEKARVGLFPEGIEGEISLERLRRFFRREDHVYRIDKMIRDACVFARHNVTADPPFSHLDLISCRNVLIYLTSPLQKRVMSAFHYALNVPGFLVLGSSETVGDYTDVFELKEQTHRVYAKKATASRPHVFFSAPDYRAGAAIIGRHPPAPGPTAHDFQKETDRILLGRYAPPGVLLNENFDILQFRGRTSPYLELPSGEPTTNVLKMAREGLLLELRNVLIEAKKNGRVARREGVRLRTDSGVREITLEVIPVRPREEGTCYLILFQDPTAWGAGALGPPAEKPPEPLPSSEAEAARELLQLRQELAATREYLQSMVEQPDAANEELRSANEEILSSNEELQSTNEELETAKEELQSTNEELSTVNEQLQRRKLELDLVNNDLLNLFSSTSIPLVMVGGDLRIRRFTAPARKVMNLAPTDVGRPPGPFAVSSWVGWAPVGWPSFLDLRRIVLPSVKQQTALGRPLRDVKVAAVVPDLEQIIGEVIENVKTVEREVRDREGRWYVMRVHPYRTADNKIDGAVLMLVDIDEMRRDQEELRRQAALLEMSQDAIVVRDAQNRITFWNRGAQEMYGWSADEARGQPIDQLLKTDPAAWAALNARLDQHGSWEGELRQTRRDGNHIIVHSREVLVRDEAGARAAVLAIKRDMTEFHRMVDALKQADRRKDEFLATLAHELRNPLAPIRNVAEIFRRASNDPAMIAKARDMLDRQVRQISGIVEDLIDVTRIVEKKIELRKERVALAPVVETALESCRSAIEGYGHRLTVTLPPEPLYLDADPVRLSQVLINLLNNAAKYTPFGGQIWLTAERAGGELIVRVRDTGIGIKAELLPHVFDMFTQGESGPKQGRGGLGVGLTLVRSLVQMHGGSVEVHSSGPGHGSEFVVHLPLAASRSEPAREAGRGAARRATLTPRRILVVDDNQDQAESLGQLLKLMGHEVQLAFNGQRAVEAAIDFRPDVALLDIGLPGMNGYEVARRIRQHPHLSDVVLVAQTGWGQEEDRRRSQEAGFDHHLVKPVGSEVLEEVVRTLPRK
jgi:two-component system CheB/CheR fusion protein